jgi:hypothetical protein
MGLRPGDSTSTEVSERAFEVNNRFVNFDTAYNISKITVVELSGSLDSGVRLQRKFSNGAKRTAAPEAVVLKILIFKLMIFFGFS